MNDVSLAAALVRDAGMLAQSMLVQGLETQYKTSVSDVVSAADRAAERLIVERLAAECPEDGLIGEEGSRKSGGERTWYVDPVDGTYNFLSGVPYWCSAVGLVDADGPYLGAVYYPVMDQLWLGGRDHPTTLNGVPVASLIDQTLTELSVATYLHPRHFGETARGQSWRAATVGAATVRMLGSASIDLASVASGRLGAFLQADLFPWDWYPGAALVLGAGGAIGEVTVGENRWQIAGNSTVVADLTAALQRSDMRSA